MENKKTLENEKAEVQTEEKRNGAAGVITTDSTEQKCVDNTDYIDVDDEEIADECVAVDLRRKEKAIIITIGVILALLLIWLIIWAMGTARDYASARTDIGNNYSYNNSDPADSNSGDKNGAYDADNGKDNDAHGDGSDSDANSQINSGNNGNGGNNNPTVNNDGGDNGNNGNGSNGNDSDNSGNKGNGDNNGGGSQTPGTSSGDQGDATPSDTTGGDNFLSGDDDGNGGNNCGGNQNDDNKDDDAAPDYTGETKVRISEVNDDTGFVTITIDSTFITVPLQTTVFNGRVTKSGVAQGKLFGYNSGITVMLFYPHDEGFHTTEVNAYMSRTSDALTVLVDISGDGSKLLIKVNGMKSLF